MMASQVSQKYGAIATHMAKPFADRSGSAAHIHFHLASTESGKNVFLDNEDKQGLGLSEAAYHFIGGIIAHAPALCCINSPNGQLLQTLADGCRPPGPAPGTPGPLPL